jgi:hypothetical protein
VQERVRAAIVAKVAEWRGVEVSEVDGTAE